ncbi:hypothetical protein BpHYR1_035244 [Brachionus plicatilis]|uniref:BED-type domain-containing protein n=1 Tax=Brachionus plicatilis TaxID=10195 RepID=A0A3M7QSZ9_BRAPC|nr:hypothetical protein BpHYR1_035244 [Brachionus plicatilis]
MLSDLTNTPTSQTDSTPVSTLKRRKKIEPRSWVWQSRNVVKINESSAKCNICQQVITFYNSLTTELVKHLAEKHKISKLPHENIRPSKCFCLDFEEMANEPEESSKTIKEYLAPDLKIEKINEKTN